VNGRPFKVIGLLGPSEKFLGLGSDNQVIIPLTQLLANFNSSPEISIEAKAMDSAHTQDSVIELQALLRRYRHLTPGQPDNFGIHTQEGFAAFFNRTVGLIEAIGIGITSLSLIVGGIGIMNIMFVSVAERTREIGVCRALGAKRRTVLMQFLFEAILISLGGGVAGLIVAYPATWLTPHSIPMAFSGRITLAALLISAGTGLVSGFLPAYRASRMKPVDALRDE
jgi:putative ABC transport system permease protein